MGRSGYTDDCWDDDQWMQIRWRGAVNSALKGKRGQAFLREMLEALDGIPDKRLITGDLVVTESQQPNGNGCCAIGAVAIKRGVDVSGLEVEDSERIGRTFGIANAMVCEIEWINDDYWMPETDEERWNRVRSWIEVQLTASATPSTQTRQPDSPLPGSA